MKKQALVALAALLGSAAPGVAQKSASPYGFSVKVSLSPAAVKKLTDLSESILVISSYSGEMDRKPTRAEIKRAKAEGYRPTEVFLTGDRVPLPPTGGIADMPGTHVEAADAAAVGRNPLDVNINVISARRTSSDNLLSCAGSGLLQDLRANMISLECRLIEEL